VRNTTLSHPTRDLLRKYADKLEQFCDRITACRVMVEVPQRYPAGAPIMFRVRLDLTVPGEELVVKRQPHPELETAIQDAFDAAGRRLQDYVRRVRGQVKQREGSDHGVVAELFPYEGYGFLRAVDGREVYFHRNSVLDGAFDALEVGAAVRFAEEAGEQGPQASTVAPVGKSH
jgi:cold shock CspA family protein